MHINTRNINTGFRKFVQYFYHGINEGMSGSRVVRESYSNPNGSGTVLRIPEPVLITFTHPRERVLFNEVRDINPFFALYETLWMLSGRNDVGSLSYYNSKIKDFSDDGKTLNGAYGYRWRNHERVVRANGAAASTETTDQLDILVNHLKADPTSRRAVLQMWNVEDDLLKIGLSCDRCGGSGEEPWSDDPDRGPRICSKCNNRSQPGFKDVCCNLSVMFSLRQTNWISAQGVGVPDKPVYSLDITVTNRSNDLLWGTFGNDYVVFSFLQEYTAARLGVEVGVYHHFSNNLHVYDKRKDWKPVELLNDQSGWNPLAYHDTKIPFVSDPVKFDHEALACTDFHRDGNRKGIAREWAEPFIQDVAHPAFQALHYHKAGDHNKADGWLRCIKADDWRLVCTQWISRRTKQEKEHVS